MVIVGHGIDLTEVGRIARMRAEHGSHFLDRCFTPGEQAYCLAYKHRGKEAGAHEGADIRFAGRFAAKEAVLKVLGTGWRGQIAWTDIEILNHPSGKPELTLGGECGKIAHELKITNWYISISHTDTHAIGSAIGCRA